MKNNNNKKETKDEEQKFLVGIGLGLIVISIACGIAAVAALVFVFWLLGSFTIFAFVILLIAAVIFLLLGFGCFSYYYTIRKDGITKTRFHISVFKKWEELEFEIRLFEKSSRVFIDFFEDENQPNDTKLTFFVDKKFVNAIKRFAPDELRKDIEEKYNYITADENFPNTANEGTPEAAAVNIDEAKASNSNTAKITDKSENIKLTKNALEISEERLSEKTKGRDTEITDGTKKETDENHSGTKSKIIPEEADGSAEETDENISD